jgi:glutaredoxin
MLSKWQSVDDQYQDIADNNKKNNKKKNNKNLVNLPSGTFPQVIVWVIPSSII